MRRGDQTGYLPAVVVCAMRRLAVALLVAAAIAFSGCADEAPDEPREREQTQPEEVRGASARGNGSEIEKQEQVWSGSVAAGPGVGTEGETMFDVAPGNWTYLIAVMEGGAMYAGVVHAVLVSPTGGEAVIYDGMGAAAANGYIGINSFAGDGALPFEPGTWTIRLQVDGLADVPFSASVLQVRGAK
jgi:hypothetical protein